MPAKKFVSGFINPVALAKQLQDQAGTPPPELEGTGLKSVEVVRVETTPSQTTPAQSAPGQPESTQAKPVEVGQAGGGSAEPMPWHTAHPKLKIHFGLRLPEPLHKKFEYAAAHTLGDSMQTFALRALDEAVHKRLKELGVI